MFSTISPLKWVAEVIDAKGKRGAARANFARIVFSVT
jgi:hypothetical protein